MENRISNELMKEKITNESQLKIYQENLFHVRNQHFFLHNKKKEFVNRNKSQLKLIKSMVLVNRINAVF